MTRQETQIIKGIALLLMLWLHLFSNVEQTLSCENYIFIGGTPLANLITRACPPVGFFVFCGGYGLYYTYKKGQDKHYITRIAKIFIAYWLILFVSIPLCVLITDISLKIDWKSIILNLTALEVSWDYPCWFILPYVLLSLSYPWIFPIYDKIRVRYILTIAFCIQLLSMTLIHYGELTNIPFLGILICYFEFLFLFFCGATVYRCNLLTRIRRVFKELRCFRLWQILGIIIIVMFKIVLNSAADGGLYTLGIIFMILAIPPNPEGLIAKILVTIGNHSMNMWMIHFMLYAILLHNFIFSLRYPFVIFGALLLFSYITSILMNVALKPLYKIIKIS